MNMLSSLLSALLFAVSTSLDAFLVGISYGLRRITISFFHNLIISLIALAGTILSFLTGQFLSPFFPDKIADLAGSAVLIAMGSYYLVKFMCASVQKYVSAKIHSQKIPGVCKIKEGGAGQPSFPMANTSGVQTQLREILLLGAALSANNIGVGTAASMAGLLLLPAAVLSLLCSLCMLSLGNRLGSVKLSGPLDRLAGPLSGVLLLGLGLFALLGAP